METIITQRMRDMSSHLRDSCFRDESSQVGDRGKYYTLVRADVEVLLYSARELSHLHCHCRSCYSIKYDQQVDSNTCKNPKGQLVEDSNNKADNPRYEVKL